MATAFCKLIQLVSMLFLCNRGLLLPFTDESQSDGKEISFNVELLPLEIRYMQFKMHAYISLHRGNETNVSGYLSFDINQCYHYQHGTISFQAMELMDIIHSIDSEISRANIRITAQPKYSSPSSRLLFISGSITISNTKIEKIGAPETNFSNNRDGNRNENWFIFIVIAMVLFLFLQRITEGD